MLDARWQRPDDSFHERSASSPARIVAREKRESVGAASGPRFVVGVMRPAQACWDPDVRNSCKTWSFILFQRGMAWRIVSPWSWGAQKSSSYFAAVAPKKTIWPLVTPEYIDCRPCCYPRTDAQHHEQLERSPEKKKLERWPLHMLYGASSLSTYLKLISLLTALSPSHTHS